MTEQTGGGRRVRGGWVVYLLFAVPFAAILIAEGRDVLFAVWGPVVPVEVVKCHESSKGMENYCTGVWRPTGEPEKTITIHGEAPQGTANVRIHGDDAWAYDEGMISKKLFYVGFWGLVGLFVVIVLVVYARKPKS